MSDLNKYFQICIISWSGQHEKALSIAKKLTKIINNVYIVYSDPDPNFELKCPNYIKPIKTSNSKFWGDKFKTCLSLFQKKYLIIIHSDCECGNWVYLIDRCAQAYESCSKIGVWSPKVDYTPWDLRKTFIQKIPGTSLQVVSQTDGLVFCLNDKIIERMNRINYESNDYGWGIDWLFVSNSYASGYLAVVDDSVQVFHPRSRGYCDKKAYRQELDFSDQFELTEKAVYKLLKSYTGRNEKNLNLIHYINNLSELINEMNKHDSIVIWGVGSVSKIISPFIQNKIKNFVDKNEELCGSVYFNKKILPINSIFELKRTLLVITPLFRKNEIRLEMKGRVKNYLFVEDYFLD